MGVDRESNNSVAASICNECGRGRHRHFAGCSEETRDLEHLRYIDDRVDVVIDQFYLLRRMVFGGTFLGFGIGLLAGWWFL